MINIKTILLLLIILFFFCSCSKNEENTITTISQSEITHFTTSQFTEQEYTGTAEHLVTSNTFIESELQDDLAADTAVALNIIADNQIDSADVNFISADNSVYVTSGNSQLSDRIVINSDNFNLIKPDTADSENIIIPDDYIENKEVMDKPDRKDNVSITDDNATKTKK